QERPYNVNEKPDYNEPLDGEPNKPRPGMPCNEEPQHPTPLNGTTETQFINIETSEYRLPERDSPQKPYIPGYNEPEPSEPNDLTPGYEDETVVTSTRRTVAKHIQKFESNTLRNTTPKQLKGPKSPPKPVQKPTNQRKPDESLGRRPQSPTKQVSPTRTPKKPKEPETFDQEHPQQLRPSKPRFTEDGEEIVEEFVTPVENPENFGVEGKQSPRETDTNKILELCEKSRKSPGERDPQKTASAEGHKSPEETNSLKV
ncbi:hypothetical protein DOY81_015661, partial [Sarcophaga bullata]